MQARVCGSQTNQFQRTREPVLLFQTPIFAFLLAVTLACFYLLPRSLRSYWLAAASLAFYMYSGILDTGILISTIALTYLLSLKVTRHGPVWPILSAAAMMLGALVYFKYSEFVFFNIDRAFGTSLTGSRNSLFETILPLGISFYTFQITAYLIDLRRGDTERAKSPLEYFLFVTYFPQLIAGPIMRGREYLPQLDKLVGARVADIKFGGLLILSGLVKKVVLSDFLISQRVDARFGSDSFTQPEVFVGSALFAFEIYFDFSGYVDIALGIARLFGIKLSRNFRTPYLAKNPSEFWRRWHITLSDWVRDYMYVPLGGNRKGVPREFFNLIVVMVIVGFWHGAGWTFALWGLIHGLLLVGQRIGSKIFQTSRIMPYQLNGAKFSALTAGVTLLMVILAWIPFRAPNLATTYDMYRALISPASLSEWAGQANSIGLLAVFFALHLAENSLFSPNGSVSKYWRKAPKFARALSYATAFMAVIQLSSAPQSFIYFRF